MLNMKKIDLKMTYFFFFLFSLFFVINNTVNGMVKPIHRHRRNQLVKGHWFCTETMISYLHALPINYSRGCYRVWEIYSEYEYKY